MNSKRLENILITNSFTYDEHRRAGCIKQAGWKITKKVVIRAGCNKGEQAGKLRKFYSASMLA